MSFVFANNDSNSPWKKFAVSIGYDKMANYDNVWVANGTNTNNNSIDLYFLGYADGLRLDEISALPGESISEVEIATWLVADGDYVTKDQAIAEVDSDKATLELPAEESGVITLKAAEGEVVKVGQVVCLIDTSAPAPANTPKTIEKETAVPSIAVEKAPNPDPIVKESSYAAGSPSPAALKIMNENNISAAQVVPTGKDGRITKGDVLNAVAAGATKAAAPAAVIPTGAPTKVLPQVAASPSPITRTPRSRRRLSRSSTEFVGQFLVIGPALMPTALSAY